MDNEYIYDIHDIRMAIAGLTVYRGITTDDVIKGFLELLDLLEDESVIPYDIVNAYHWFIYDLLSLQSFDGVNPWKDHILELILNDDNFFSRYCQDIDNASDVPYAVQQAVRSDMRHLQLLSNIDSDMLKRAIAFRTGLPTEQWVGWDILYNPEYQEDWNAGTEQDGDDSVAWLYKQRLALKRRLAASTHWEDAIGWLVAFYKNAGVGMFNQYLAFRWMQGQKEYIGYLEGVADVDPIRIGDIIGYDVQKQQVLDNTESFVAGYAANNMLLYGDRGTGKSSTVKALIHRFGKRGLRLVEVSKADLKDFPKIIRMLSKFKQRFVLFVDDLSFDGDESEYSGLKAVLEGSIEAKPDNVVIYATSNRRHLVKEYFSDKEAEELHEGDTKQQKLSLADRFGIVVTFFQPDQDQYLAIVDGLAKQHGLRMNAEELHRLALQWQAKHNGRSGRTAAQFITYMLAHAQ